MFSSILSTKSDVSEEHVKCISFDRKKVLGTGKFSSVFMGSLKTSTLWFWTENKQPVAVKQVLKGPGNVIDLELIKWVITSKNNIHPKILQYYAIEENQDFWYLASEVFDESLKNYARRSWENIEDGIQIKSSKDLNNSIGIIRTLIDLCRQAAEGIAFVHRNSFIHKDINPNNLLVRSIQSHDDAGRAETVICKLADLGLSKQLMDNPNTLSSKLDFNAIEWIAPELLSKPFTCSTKSDVWAFGCVIYNILSAGKHPFAGFMYRRSANVLAGEFDLTFLRLLEFQPRNEETRLVNLIGKMIDRAPINRPDMEHVVDVLNNIGINNKHSE